MASHKQDLITKINLRKMRRGMETEQVLEEALEFKHMKASELQELFSEMTGAVPKSKTDDLVDIIERLCSRT